MSTRATYLLPSTGYSNQSVCFYIHHNGNLKGTARYFYNMHQCENGNSSPADRFFRANFNAEFTTCHEEHADTNFRYTINHHNILTAWQKNTLKNVWQIVYEGLWHQFVNTYLLEESQYLHTFKLYRTLQNETIMTVGQAQKWVSAFTYSAKKDAKIREGIEAIQAQIDAILAQQKTEPKQIEIAEQSWEERFALFAKEFENKMADWAKQNQIEYCANYSNRIVTLEKFDQDFHLFFERSIFNWIQESGILKSKRNFDLGTSKNALYTRIKAKYGINLPEAIQAIKIECGYPRESNNGG